jgi:hypothetical protein
MRVQRVCRSARLIGIGEQPVYFGRGSRPVGGDGKVALTKLATCPRQHVAGRAGYTLMPLIRVILRQRDHHQVRFVWSCCEPRPEARQRFPHYAEAIEEVISNRTL